jgi:hypothetical protein
MSQRDNLHIRDLAELNLLLLLPALAGRPTDRNQIICPNP